MNKLGDKHNVRLLINVPRCFTSSTRSTIPILRYKSASHGATGCLKEKLASSPRLSSIKSYYAEATVRKLEHPNMNSLDTSIFSIHMLVSFYDG